ncbi:MAG: 6-pyruvoyl-tetrahydropterin synthase-related protein [Acidimicrobiia bacterium]
MMSPAEDRQDLEETNDGAVATADLVVLDVALTDAERLGLDLSGSPVESSTIVAEQPEVDADGAPQPRRSQRIASWVAAHAVGLTSFVIVAGSVFMVLWTLHPELILSPSTPTGGDNGAHVPTAAYLRDYLLPQGRLFGWMPDNYGGFPILQFYFPLPPLLVVLLDVVVPYGVAFKIVTALGVVTMPVSAWFLGRSAKLPFPAPPLLALATIPFMFDRGYVIYGGNLGSTLVGEYHYSIALSLMLVYLGVLVRVCTERKGRALLGVLAAALVLTHLIVAVFAVIATVVVLAVYRPGARRLVGHVLPAILLGGLITSFWSLPFLDAHHYTADGGFEKITDYVNMLFPTRNFWAAGLAMLGLAAGVQRRQRPVIALGLFALSIAALFRFIPRTRLWNGRIVPCFYLCTFLLAAFGAIEVVNWVVRTARSWRQRDVTTPLRLRHQVGGAMLCAAVVFVHQGLPIGIVPLSSLDVAHAERNFLGVGAKDAGLRNWSQWNYEGYEKKNAWPEYAGLNDTMAEVGKQYGCGRALYEYEADQTRFGSPMALDILSYWNGGCVGSLEGLFIEASPTSPFHFLLASEASKAPSTPVFGIPYRSYDLNYAVPHMRLLGVKYYMTFSPELIEQANARPDLVEVASFQRWHIYMVRDAKLVEGLNIIPIVDDSLYKANYENWNKGALRVWDTISDQQFYISDRGPKEWPRIGADGTLPTQYIEPTKVTNVQTNRVGNHITFDVDQIGKPVVVRVSYFPNWTASGADGPYRLTPNLMVVIPRATHVELTYDRSTAEIAGMGVSGFAVAALGALAVHDRRRRRRIDGVPVIIDEPVTQ